MLKQTADLAPSGKRSLPLAYRILVSFAVLAAMLLSIIAMQSMSSPGSVGNASVAASHPESVLAEAGAALMSPPENIATTLSLSATATATSTLALHGAHRGLVDVSFDDGACALIWMLCIIGIIAVLISVLFFCQKRSTTLFSRLGNYAAPLYARHISLSQAPSLHVLSVCQR